MVGFLSKETKDIKDIFVVGVGSLGSCLGLKLAATGHNVTLLRSSKIADFKEGKIAYINDKEYKIPKIVEKIPVSAKFDYLFVTCKLYDLRTLLKEIAQKDIKFNLIISIQNTLFDDMWYFDYIKDKPFSIVSVYEGYYLKGNKITVSELKGWFVEDDILGKDVSNILNDAEIKTGLVSDLRRLRAEKTVLNCFLNALSAIENMTLKQMYDNIRVRKRMKAIFNETYDVLSELVKMKAKRMLWQELINRVKEMNHYSSTWQDVTNGRKTEVAFLNGYIVSLGKSLGKSTPENINIVEEFRKKHPALYYVQI